MRQQGFCQATHVHTNISRNLSLITKARLRERLRENRLLVYRLHPDTAAVLLQTGNKTANQTSYSKIQELH